jgi:carbamate kinase
MENKVKSSILLCNATNQIAVKKSDKTYSSPSKDSEAFYLEKFDHQLHKQNRAMQMRDQQAAMR